MVEPVSIPPAFGQLFVLTLILFDRQIFPVQLSEGRSVHEESVIARIKERRRQMREEAGDEVPPPTLSDKDASAVSA
jgi:hypothetical protein